MKILLVLGSCLVLVVGCQQVPTQEVDYPARIASLEAELARSDDLLADREQQIRNLQNIPKPVVELLTKVNKISLGRYSRPVDSDKDELIDELVVYLQIYDASGDLIKVAGSVTVELWDLNTQENNLVKRWGMNPEQLEKTWDGGFLADHYHLELPVEDYAPAGKELNLKISFIETLTGKSWDMQKVVSVQ